jgi:hypothetical protein
LLCVIRIGNEERDAEAKSVVDLLLHSTDAGRN